MEHYRNKIMAKAKLHPLESPKLLKSSKYTNSIKAPKLSKAKPKAAKIPSKKYESLKSQGQSPLLPTILGLSKDKGPVKCGTRKNLGKSTRKPLEKPLTKSSLKQGKPRAPVKKSKLKSAQIGKLGRKITMIDAGPQKVRRGTPVLFLGKNSPQGQQMVKKKKAAAPSAKLPRRKISSYSRSRMDARFKTIPESRTQEGVDFFYNLGLRNRQTKPGGNLRLQGGVGLARSWGAGARPGAWAGLMGASGGRIDPAGATHHMPGTGPGLGAMAGAVATSGIGLSAKSVEVPLTNRLPIIDIISTNEFQNMYA
ncbi:hypothetical protein KR009_012302, partial [Drosophila setifemur]